MITLKHPNEASCNKLQDPTFVEPISLPSTFVMTSNASHQPHESTSKTNLQPFGNTFKAIHNPNESTSKSLNRTFSNNDTANV